MSFFTNLIYEYGIFAMFLIILIEYACFPISSEIVLPFCGAIAYMNHISFLLILLISVLAGLMGTSLCYFLGRIGGDSIIESLKKRFPKSRIPLDNSYNQFNKHGSLAICIGRFIPLCRTYIAFIAGLAKQNYITFLFFSFIGITLWNATLISLGYFLKEKWSFVSNYYHQYKTFVTRVIIVLLFLAIFYMNKKKDKVEL